MSTPIRKWIAISFFNLVLVAALGVIMRYKIAFYLPWIQQKFVLHSHSHFAFAGWITQTLMVLLVHYLGTKTDRPFFTRYRWLLFANLVTAYGMLVSFILQGYAFFSISFSTLSIFVSYLFAAVYWKDLSGTKERNVSHWWLKAALIFSVISSIGAFGLAYMMANKIMHQNWYLAAIYFFLHFQYNGWFFFACMGLLVAKLEQMGASQIRLKQAFLLFCFAAIPAYFLSVLWLQLPIVLYGIVIAAVIAQLAGWGLTVKVVLKNKLFIQQSFSKYGRVLLLLSSIAFTIKLLLQSGSVIPSLSQLSYGFRPIIIGYLHLVLLGVTSIFIIGYIMSFELINVTRKMLTGIFIFVSGIIVNELLLMAQGVAALSYNSVPLMNLLLLIAAAVLLTGSLTIFINCNRRVSDQ
ncbi:MAG: hypothetical protein JWP81_2911 [Ferruginibacter sp.]|nr:hypothetical protein [Ferruginibacter sp.]